MVLVNWGWDPRGFKGFQLVKTSGEVERIMDESAFSMTDKRCQRVVCAICLIVALCRQFDAPLLPGFLDFVLSSGSNMDIDTELSSSQGSAKHRLLEPEIYYFLLIHIFLIEQKMFAEDKATASADIYRLKGVNRRTIDVLKSRLYCYYSSYCYDLFENPLDNMYTEMDWLSLPVASETLSTIEGAILAFFDNFCKSYICDQTMHSSKQLFFHLYDFHFVDLSVMDNYWKIKKDVHHVFNLAADMAARINGVKRTFFASSACIYIEFKQQETNVSLKEFVEHSSTDCYRAIASFYAEMGNIDAYIIYTSTCKTKNGYCFKKVWMTEESRLLVKLVNKYCDKNWGEVANHLLGRTGHQCKQRWSNHLHPDIKKDKWSKEDNDGIIGSIEGWLITRVSYILYPSEILESLKRSMIGIQDWTLGDLFVGLYLLYLHQAFTTNADDKKKNSLMLHQAFLDVEIGLSTTVHKNYFKVLKSRAILLNEFGDRVAQSLHFESVVLFWQDHDSNMQQQIIIINRPFLFSHGSTLSIIRLHQVYKIMQYVESYQLDNKLSSMSIIMCGDWNGSKHGHVSKFLRSQGFVSSYDVTHQYTNSDADAHMWVSHRYHRGNVCGVDFIWLHNPNSTWKTLDVSWSEAVFGIIKYQLLLASLSDYDAFVLMKSGSPRNYIRYSDFYQALRQLHLTGHSHGLNGKDIKRLWVHLDIDGYGIPSFLSELV